MEPSSSALSRIRWIGGAPDTGKTSVARLLSVRLGWTLYEYDGRDRRHHQLLAEKSQEGMDLNPPIVERWVAATPQELLRLALRSFADRMPLVIDDLRALTAGSERIIVAEGFAFTPELIEPLIANAHQAIWLTPTDEFRRASFERRDKPSFGRETKDHDQARANMIARDSLLSQHVNKTAAERGLKVIEVDGLQPVHALADVIERHFSAPR
jgi:2-phosphoglycerate kinase